MLIIANSVNKIEDKNKERENVNMENINIHSKMFQYRAALFVIAISLIVANFIYPNNIYIQRSMSLLLAFMLISYAVERFREKNGYLFQLTHWLACSIFFRLAKNYIAIYIFINNNQISKY